MPRISPTPLMMVVAADDHLTVADEPGGLQQGERAEALVLLPAATSRRTSAISNVAAGEAADWFARHLATYAADVT